MKLHYLDRTDTEFNSFSVTRNKHKHFLKVWHYHPELELVLVLKSTGTRFIGDSIEKFHEGDVVLIGANLPHMWINDAAYYQDGSKLRADAISIHFRKDFLGNSFMGTKELRQINHLMDKAQQGMVFHNLPTQTVDLLKKTEADASLSPFKKLLLLLDVLDQLARHKGYSVLSSKGFLTSFSEGDNKNLKAVYEYIFKNFNHPISATDVARVIHMNPSAFSRFFKRIHRKTFTAYLNEIRIGYACKLLLEGKQKILSICYDSGFNNISNFNRQFKKIKKMSPTEFLDLYAQ
ncbi:AraC family transcriptional regulator [Galbibacter sp. PAP.153]|uniref:AraC family transcriptional regulator n=1 Tax=Galbibacter sp. PAP.153 TaxID=3104623 RepID=UPI0030083DCC